MGRKRLSVEDRIRERTVVDPQTGCWEWQGARSEAGYGWIMVTKEFKVHRRQFTHRAAYEALVGPIPDGLVLDHLCRNPPCCNPDHLEPVTQGENVRRGILGEATRERTHCKFGHEFTPENTRLIPKGRRCKACENRRSAESARRKRERKAAA